MFTIGLLEGKEEYYVDNKLRCSDCSLKWVMVVSGSIGGIRWGHDKRIGPTCSMSPGWGPRGYWAF